LTYNKNNKIDPYLQQKVLSASPTQLVSYLYDIGVSACINKDKIKIGKVISHLKENLNYSPGTKKISETFCSVYDHIHFLTKNDNFTEAKNAFQDIKKVWNQANNH
jgi:flagellin-specific chaperone FliS